MDCNMSDVAHVLWGEIQTEANPFFEGKPESSEDDWRDIIHTEKGAAMGIARKVAGPSIELPLGIRGVSGIHNPLVGRLTAKAPGVIQESAFRFLAPKDSVAPSVLADVGKKIDDFEQYIGNPENEKVGDKVFQEDVASRAKELREAIENNNLPHDVSDANYHATLKFLQLVENGFPHFDFGEAKNGDLEVGHPIRQMATNLIKSHVTFNPFVYLFHAGELPIRTFAQYPAESLKVLPAIWENPKILLGQRIPEADRAGIYKYDMPDNKADWDEYDHARARTGIPQCQNVSDSLAWLLHEQGVPLDDALNNVALRNRDWRETAFMFNMPDRGGATSYIRYSLLQNAWYMNLLKRMTVGAFKDPQDALKAAGSLMLYTGAKYMLFGTKGAVPMGGMIAEHSQDAEDKAQELDEAGPGNLLFKATGIDLGGSESPLAPWALPYYPLKMLADAGQTNYRDYKKFTKAFSEGHPVEGSLTLGHSLLLDAAILGANLPWMKAGKFIWTKTPIPYSLIKAVGAYANAVKDAGDDPNYVDGHDFAEKYIQTNLGKQAAQEFANR